MIFPISLKGMLRSWPSSALVEGVKMGEDGRELVRFGRDDMVGADVGRLVEPELGKLGQNLALVRDEGGKDPVEGGNPVGGHDQELVLPLVDVPDLALFEKPQLGDVDSFVNFFHSRLRIRKLPRKCNFRNLRC